MISFLKAVYDYYRLTYHKTISKAKAKRYIKHLIYLQRCTTDNPSLAAELETIRLWVIGSTENTLQFFDAKLYQIIESRCTSEIYLQLSIYEIETYIPKSDTNPYNLSVAMTYNNLIRYGRADLAAIYKLLAFANKPISRAEYLALAYQALERV